MNDVLLFYLVSFVMGDLYGFRGFLMFGLLAGVSMCVFRVLVSVVVGVSVSCFGSCLVSMICVCAHNIQVRASTSHVQ